MRLLPVVGLLAACTSENVAPLAEFGPLSAYVEAELGPLAGEWDRLDVNPRVHVSFSHSNSDCPVFDDDIDVSIDRVRPDDLEPGYYDEGGGWGHDTGASCQTPYFSINRVPPPKALSVLRLADATAQFSLEADRLFVNPAMTIASPLRRGMLAVIDVADDRPIKTIKAMWWVGNEESAMGYDLAATVSSNVIGLQMPSETSGPGWLEVRVELAPAEPTCIGFSDCEVRIKGSATFDATLE